MNNQTSFEHLTNLICTAIALAMAVATIVLNLLGPISFQANALFLGIAIFCLAITMLNREEHHD